MLLGKCRASLLTSTLDEEFTTALFQLEVVDPAASVLPGVVLGHEIKPITQVLLFTLPLTLLHGVTCWIALTMLDLCGWVHLESVIAIWNK